MNKHYPIEEVRLIIQEEAVYCYVQLVVDDQHPLPLGGWHCKMFQPSKSLSDIVKEIINVKLWPKGLPPDY